MDAPGAAAVLLDAALTAHVQPQIHASEQLTQQLRSKSQAASPLATWLLSARQQVYDDFFYPTFNGANLKIAEGQITVQVSVFDPVLRESLHRVGLHIRDVSNSATHSTVQCETGSHSSFQLLANVNSTTGQLLCDTIKAASLLESQAAALAVPGSSRAVAAASGSAREQRIMNDHILPLAQGCVLKFHGLRDFLHCSSTRRLAASRSLQDTLSSGQRCLRVTLLLKRHVAGAGRLQPSALVVDSCVSAPLLHTLAVHRQRSCSELPGASLRHASAEWPLRVRVLRVRNLVPALLHAKVPSRNTAALPKAGKHAKAPEAAAGERTRALSFGMLDRPFRMSTASRSDSTSGFASNGGKSAGSASMAIASRRSSQARGGAVGGAAGSGPSSGSISRETSLLSTHSDGDAASITVDMQAGIVQVPGSKTSVQLDSILVRLDVVYGGEVLPGCSAESRRRQWAPHIEWTQGPSPMQPEGGAIAGGGASWLSPERLLRDIPLEAQLRFTVLGVVEALPEAVTLGVAAIPLVDHRGVVISGRHTVSCWPGKTDVRSARVGTYAPPADTFLTAHSLAEEQEEAQRNTLGATDITPGLHPRLAVSNGSHVAWTALVQRPSPEPGALHVACNLEASTALGLSTTTTAHHDTSDLSSDIVLRARRSLVASLAATARADSSSPAAFSDDDSDGDGGTLHPTSAPRPSLVEFHSEGPPRASAPASPVMPVDGAAAGRAAAASAITALGGTQRQPASASPVRNQRAPKRRTGSVYYTGEDWGQQLSAALASASRPSSTRSSVLQLAAEGGSAGDGASFAALEAPPPAPAASPVATTQRMSRAGRADSGFEFQNKLGMHTIGEDADSDSDGEGSDGSKASPVMAASAGGDPPPPPMTPLEDKRSAADVACMEAPAFLIPTLPASDTSELYESMPLTLEIEVEAFRLPVVGDAPPTRVDIATTAARAEALGMAAVADCKAAHRQVLRLGDNRSHSTMRPRAAARRPPAPPSSARLHPPAAPSTHGPRESDNLQSDTDVLACEEGPSDGQGDISPTARHLPAGSDGSELPTLQPEPPQDVAELAKARDAEWLECCNPYAAYARLRFALLCLGIDEATAASAPAAAGGNASLLQALGQAHGVHMEPWLRNQHTSPLHFGRAVQARLCAVLPPGPRRAAAVAALRSGHLPLAAALSAMLAPAHLQRHLVTDEALVYTQPHVPLLMAPRAGAVKWGTGIAMQDARYRGFYDTVPFGMQADAVSSSGDMQAAFTAAIRGPRAGAGGGSTPRELALPGSVDPALDRGAGLEGRTGLNFDAEFHIAVDKRGWMRKLGKQSWSRWRRRWFVLTERGGALRYYESNTAGQPPKGIVPLAGMAARAEPSKDRSYQRIVGSTRKNLALYCFRLGPSGEGETESDRTYFLYVEAKRSMEEWIDAVNTVALRLGAGEAAPSKGSPLREAGEALSPVMLSVSPRHSARSGDLVFDKPAGPGPGLPGAGGGSPTSGDSGNRTPPPKKASKWRNLTRIFGNKAAGEEAAAVQEGEAVQTAVPPVPAPAASSSAARQRRGRRPSMLLAGTAVLPDVTASQPRQVTTGPMSAPVVAAPGPDGPRRRTASNAQAPSRRGSVFVRPAENSSAPISVLSVPARPSVLQLLQATMQSDTLTSASVGGARLGEQVQAPKRTQSSGSRMTLNVFRARSSSGAGAHSTVLRGIAGAECAALGDANAALHGLWGGEDGMGDAGEGDAPGFWRRATSQYDGFPCALGGDVLGWWSVLDEVVSGDSTRVALPLGVLGEMAAAASLHIPRVLRSQPRRSLGGGECTGAPQQNGTGGNLSLRELLARRAGSHVLSAGGSRTADTPASRQSLSSLITLSTRRGSDAHAGDTAVVLLRPSAARGAPGGGGAAAQAILQAYPLLAALLPNGTGSLWSVCDDAVGLADTHLRSELPFDEGGLDAALGSSATQALPLAATSSIDIVAGDQGALAALIQRLALAGAAAENARAGSGEVQLPQLCSLAGGLQVLALWTAVRLSLAQFADTAFTARASDGGGSAGEATRAARVRRASVDAPDIVIALGPDIPASAQQQLREWHPVATSLLAQARKWGLQPPPSTAADARAGFSAGATGAAARDLTRTTSPAALAASASEESKSDAGAVDETMLTARRLLLLLQPLRAVLHGTVALALAQDAAVAASVGPSNAGAAGAFTSMGTGTQTAPWMYLESACLSSIAAAHLRAVGADLAARSPQALTQAAACLRRASGLPSAVLRWGDCFTDSSSAQVDTGALHDAAAAGRTAVASSRDRLQRLLECSLPPAAATDVRVWGLVLPAQPRSDSDTAAHVYWRDMQLPETYRPRNETRERLAEGRRRSHTGVHSDWRSMQPATNSDSVPDAMPATSLSQDDAALAWMRKEGRPSHVDVEARTLKVRQGLTAATALALRAVAAEYVAACWCQLNCSDDVAAEWVAPRLAQLFGAAGDTGHTAAQLAQGATGPLRTQSVHRSASVGMTADASDCLLGMYSTAAERQAANQPSSSSSAKPSAVAGGSTDSVVPALGAVPSGAAWKPSSVLGRGVFQFMVQWETLRLKGLLVMPPGAPDPLLQPAPVSGLELPNGGFFAMPLAGARAQAVDTVPSAGDAAAVLRAAVSAPAEEGSLDRVGALQPAVVDVMLGHTAPSTHFEVPTSCVPLLGGSDSLQYVLQDSADSAGRTLAQARTLGRHVLQLTKGLSHVQYSWSAPPVAALLRVASEAGTGGADEVHSSSWWAAGPASRHCALVMSAARLHQHRTLAALFQLCQQVHGATGSPLNAHWGDAVGGLALRTDWGAAPHSAVRPAPLNAVPGDSAGTVTAMVLDAVARCGDVGAPQHAVGVLMVDTVGHITSMGSAGDLGDFQLTPFVQAALCSRSERDAAASPLPSRRSVGSRTPLSGGSSGNGGASPTARRSAKASPSPSPPPVQRALPLPTLMPGGGEDVSLDLPDGVLPEQLTAAQPLLGAQHAWLPGSAHREKFASGLVFGDTADSDEEDSPKPPPPTTTDGGGLTDLLQAAADKLQQQLGGVDRPTRLSRVERRSLADSFKAGSAGSAAASSRTLDLGAVGKSPFASPGPSRTGSRQMVRVGKAAAAGSDGGVVVSKPRLRAAGSPTGSSAGFAQQIVVSGASPAGSAASAVGGAMLPNIFEQLFAADPLQKMSTMERAAVWQHRAAITHLPEALPKLVSAIAWVSRTQAREAHRLLYAWKPFPTAVAARYLELLDERHADQQVRAKAVAGLQGLSDEEVTEMVPQLVQALKFEPQLSSPLFLWLLQRALRSPLAVGMPLYWSLEVEAGGNPVTYSVVASLMRAFSSQLSPPSRALLSTQQALWGREGAFARICEHVMMHRKQGKEKLQHIARSALRSLAEQLPSQHVLPLDGRMEVGRLLVDKCKVMDSAKKPLWLVFENADPAIAGTEHPDAKVIVMFKAGDDIRQDTVVLQLIRCMDRLWKAEGLDMCMSPYRCAPTWNDGGMLEIVTASDTTANIQTRYGGTLGAFSDSVFKEWIEEHNGPEGTPEYEEAVRMFIRSAAGYCVATYVLGIGDRHNDNIMIKKSGHYFHIDFGHFLGNFKYQFGLARELTGFVFTPEMLAVMGGREGAGYAGFLELGGQAFNIVRKHAAELINLLSLMLPCRMPELRTRDDIQYLKERLGLALSDGAAAALFKAEAEAALSDTRKRIDNTIHILVHR